MRKGLKYFFLGYPSKKRVKSLVSWETSVFCFLSGGRERAIELESCTKYSFKTNCIISHNMEQWCDCFSSLCPVIVVSESVVGVFIFVVPGLLVW